MCFSVEEKCETDINSSAAHLTGKKHTQIQTRVCEIIIANEELVRHLYMTVKEGLDFLCLRTIRG